MAQVIWTSPLDTCDICGRDFDGVMYDAKVMGGWGNCCSTCFTADPTAKLGLGLGQRYALETRNDKTAWYQTNGGSAK